MEGLERLARSIVRNRRFIIIFCLLLVLPSLWGYDSTGVNFDLQEYLPENLNSTVGQQILEKNFKSSGNAILMLEDSEKWQAQSLKEKILGIGCVSSVQWIDDFAHISIPSSFIPPSIRDRFISGKSAFLIIEFSESATSAATGNAIKKIRSIAGKEARLSGFAAVMHDLKNVMDSEHIWYIVIAITAMLIILSLSMSSALEPLLVLASMGISVIYNMGTNIIQGQISYISQSVGAVLQLGVSMDYGIFLIHRYEEERGNFISREDAMVRAVARTGTAISASALTTVAGFMALLAMKFGLGSDLGIVMAKGVLFSVINTLILLPGLILAFDRQITRYRHKVLIPDFRLLSKWIVKKRRVLLAFFLILFIPVFAAQKNQTVFYGLTEGMSKNIPSIADLEVVKDKYGAAEFVNLITADMGLSREKELLGKISEIHGVKSVTGMSSLVDPYIPDGFIPREIEDRFQSGGYTYCNIELALRQGTGEANEVLEKIESTAASMYNEYYLTGEAVMSRDLMNITGRDIVWVNWFSIASIALIIALSFLSPTIPLLLVASIQFAIWVNMGISYMAGESLYFVVYIILGAIQLGATVDYAILLTSKYGEALKEHERLEAMKIAVEKSGRSIMTSALTFIGATIGVALVSNIKMIAQFCGTLGRGAAISALVIIFILPSLLLLFHSPINATTPRWAVHETDEKRRLKAMKVKPQSHL